MWCMKDSIFILLVKVTNNLFVNVKEIWHNLFYKCLLPKVLLAWCKKKVFILYCKCTFSPLLLTNGSLCVRNKTKARLNIVVLSRLYSYLFLLHCAQLLSTTLLLYLVYIYKLNNGIFKSPWYNMLGRNNSNSIMYEIISLLRHIAPLRDKKDDVNCFVV